MLTVAILGTAALPSKAQISSVTITVNDTSVSATSINSSAGTTLCDGTQTVLQVSGGSLGTNAVWEWFDQDPSANAGLSPIQSGSWDTLAVTPTVGTTDYYVRAVGSCNTTQLVSIAITVNPTPEVDPVSSDSFCFGEQTSPIALNGTPTGITFDISGGTDIGLADQTGVTEIPSFVVANTTNTPLTNTITITPNVNGCAGTATTVDLTALPQVALAAAVADDTVCSGEAVAVNFVGNNNNPGSGVTFEWEQYDGGNIGNPTTSGTGDISFTASNPTNSATSNVAVAGNYVVTPTYTLGTKVCTSASSDSFTIVVRPEPYGTLDAANEFCEGSPVQITFNATTGDGPFTLEIEQDGSGTNTGYNNVNSGTAVDITPAPASGSHTYDLMKITDANGCIKE